MKDEGYSNDATVSLLTAFLQQHRASERQGSLTNVTFWCGAGFSKSWDPSYPTGNELFNGSVTWKFDLLPTICDSLGIDSGALNLNSVKEIVYALEMYRKYTDLRPRFVDAHLIDAALGELVDWVESSLRKRVARMGYLAKGDHRFLRQGKTPGQTDITRLFAKLLHMSHGGGGRATGVRPHFLTTNYDFVVESILDDFFDGDDDSIFLYTYRGFTPTSIRNLRHVRVAHDNWLVTNLLKLNGGLEIKPDGTGYCLDYSERSIDSQALDRPRLILPSRYQDYSDPYFQEVFRKAVRLLRETKVFVVVGYSFPEEDALLRLLVRQFAESSEDSVDKMIVYVDPSPAGKSLGSLFAHQQPDGPTLATFVGPFGQFASALSQSLP